MSNTITTEEYRRMIGKKATPSPKDTAALVRQDVKEIFQRNEKKQKQPKSVKLTVEEAVMQVCLMLDMDETQIKKAGYVINQLRLNGKL
jgi:hypothetical protein